MRKFSSSQTEGGASGLLDLFNKGNPTQPVIVKTDAWEYKNPVFSLEIGSGQVLLCFTWQCGTSITLRGNPQHPNYQRHDTVADLLYSIVAITPGTCHTISVMHQIRIREAAPLYKTYGTCEEQRSQR